MPIHALLREIRHALAILNPHARNDNMQAEMRGARWVDALRGDLRFALRYFARHRANVRRLAFLRFVAQARAVAAG